MSTKHQSSCVISFKAKAIVILVALMAIGWIFYANIETSPAQISDTDWINESYITKSYYAAKKAFNSQKQAVIDAYNNQIDKISVYGLKTKDDFHGLRFKTDIFKNNSDGLKDAINSDFENAVSRPEYQKDERKAEISKLVDKLNSNVAAKIAKIKDFYDARIGGIYNFLRNGRKVNFSSLKEYSANGKTSSFSHKDFDFVGSELKKYKVANDNVAVAFLFGTLLAMVSAYMFFAIIMLLGFSD